MKLLVSELELWRRYVSREFYFVMAEMMANYGWRHIEAFKLWNGRGTIKSKLIEEFGEMPQVILFWEGYNYLFAQAAEVYRLDCHKFIFADDLHWGYRQEGLKKFLCLSVCDAVLSSYAYVFDRFYPQLAEVKPVVWIPHSASPDFMVRYNDHPLNAILLSGSIDNNYPFRQRMKRLQEQMSGAIAYHPHPGYRCNYDYEKDEAVGQGYAAKINRYRAAFTDSSKYAYLIAKYFEIPATGALLLADASVAGRLKELGLEANKHYLAVSNDDLEERIGYVLDEKNHQELDEIRRRGQELIRDRHKTSDRARLIDKICVAG
jgi:hypothetical protein